MYNIKTYLISFEVSFLSEICAARAGTRGTGRLAASPNTARSFQGLKHKNLEISSLQKKKSETIA